MREVVEFFNSPTGFGILVGILLITLAFDVYELFFNKEK